MPSKRPLGWERRSCSWATRQTTADGSSRIRTRVRADTGAVPLIMNYATGSGKRCIMKRREALIAALTLLFVWQVLAMVVNLAILPAPLKVFGVFFQELQNGLSNHFVFSLWRVFAGMALSVLGGGPIG